MAHELTVALQQTGRIRQCCAVKEPHVDVRTEYIDIAEGRISQTCNRTAVMQKLQHLVPALSHHLKPPMRDGSQFPCMPFHPRIDGGIPLDSFVESQQFRSHRRSTLGVSHGRTPTLQGTQLPIREPRFDSLETISRAPSASQTLSLQSHNGRIQVGGQVALQTLAEGNGWAATSILASKAANCSSISPSHSAISFW